MFSVPLASDRSVYILAVFTIRLWVPSKVRRGKLRLFIIYFFGFFLLFFFCFGFTHVSFLRIFIVQIKIKYQGNVHSLLIIYNFSLFSSSVVRMIDWLFLFNNLIIYPWQRVYLTWYVVYIFGISMFATKFQLIHIFFHITSLIACSSRHYEISTKNLNEICILMNAQLNTLWWWQSVWLLFAICSNVERTG